MNAVLPPSNMPHCPDISILIVTTVNGIGSALNTKFIEIGSSIK